MTTQPLPATRAELERWLRGKVVRSASLVHGDVTMRVAPYKMSRVTYEVRLVPGGAAYIDNRRLPG